MRFATLLTCALSLVAIPPLFAANESCQSDTSMELFIAFFPRPFVADTLEKFNVPSEKRAAIQEQLTHHELDIISIVEAKAAKMNPNPLNQPDQQEQVIQLFDDAVSQVFTQVLEKNGVSDQEKIMEMLEDIHRQKAERFRRCMLIEAPPTEESEAPIVR